MTYIIENTQGTQIATVNDGQVNNNFDITLIGRNYTNYGQIFNDNLIRMLENFASDAAHKPPKPIAGQLWWRKDDQVLSVWDDTGHEWLPIAGGGITLKDGHVGINNKNPKYDLDVTYTFRTKGAAWINVTGDNLETVHNGMVLGALAKNIAPTLPGIGTFSIISNDPDATKLKGSLKLFTDPAQNKRRLAIYAEENNAAGVVTVNENGGLVGVGTNSPGKLFDVAGDARALTFFVSQNGQNITADATKLKLRSGVLTVESVDGVTTKASINAVGNMSLGPFDPVAIETYPTLDIRGNVGGGLRYGNASHHGYLYADATGLRMGSQTADKINFYTNSTVNTNPLMTLDNGKLGINQPVPANRLDIITANHTTEGMRLLSDGGQWAQMHASLDNGQYNPSVKSGYSGIIYSEGTIDTGHFVIAPWGSTASGITLDAGGRLGTNTASTVSFTGIERGAIRVSDITSTANQWTDIDFGNLVNGDTPLARIGMYYTSGGSYLALGTSNNNTAGVTNQALTIGPTGKVGIGLANPLVNYGLSTQEPVYINYQGTDITPSATWSGQITAGGAGYAGGLALDATGLWLGHNSAIRSIVFATNETENARILPNGNMGINKQNPSQKLEVNGGLQISGSAVLPDSSMPGLFSYEAPNFRTYIGDGTGFSHKFSKRANAVTTDLVTISDVGDVGIGGPAQPYTNFTTLSLDNPIDGGMIRLYRRGSEVAEISAHNDDFIINALGGNKKLRLSVDNMAKLIIGPDGSVYTQSAVGGAQGDGTINAHGLYVDGQPVVTSANIRYPITANETWIWSDPGGQSTYYWGSNDGHAMNPYATARLSVAFATNSTNAANATNATTAAIANSINPSNNYQMNSLGVGCGPAGTTGTIYTTNNIVAYYSDQRLKKNIELIADPLNKVLSLRGVTYTQNETAEQYGYNNYESQVGVIAQDVQAVLPEAVKLAPFDTGTDGSSKSGENYMTVQYEKIVPLLIEAIKELTVKVAVLEERLK